MSLSSRQMRLIAAVAGLNLLLVVGGWMALVSPQRHDASAAAAQVAAVQTQLDALVGKGSQGPPKQPAIKTADLYALDTALPSQADQPDLLLELDRLAKGSGVQVISISPQMAQANVAGYTVVPINLSVNGTYFKVTEFIQNLRTLVSETHGRLVAHGPLFAVVSAALTAGSGGQRAAPATIGMEAFYYGVTAGASAPVSPTATDTTTTTGG